jgi:hypothetical protein
MWLPIASIADGKMQSIAYISCSSRSVSSDEITTKRAGHAKVMAGIIAKQCHSGHQRHAHHLIMQSFRSCVISHFRHTQHPPLAPESQA